jgi:hypothetical protein
MARQYDDGEATRRQGERVVKRADSPFQRRWLYCLILKYTVIAMAVAFTFYTVYRLYRG